MSSDTSMPGVRRLVDLLILSPGEWIDVEQIDGPAAVYMIGKRMQQGGGGQAAIGRARRMIELVAEEVEHCLFEIAVGKIEAVGNKIRLVPRSMMIQAPDSITQAMSPPTHTDLMIAPEAIDEMGMPDTAPGSTEE